MRQSADLSIYRRIATGVLWMSMRVRIPSPPLNSGTPALSRIAAIFDMKNMKCLKKHTYIYTVLTEQDTPHKSTIGRFLRICLKCSTCDIESFFPYIQPNGSVWMEYQASENDILKWKAEHFAGLQWIDKLYE